MACLHGEGSHPPSLPGARAHEGAERLPNLLHRGHARPLRHLAEGDERPRGRGGADPGRLRAGHHCHPGRGRSRAFGTMMIPRQAAARLAALLALDESPWRVALALAVGVFISFTPFWGFQTLLALLVATVCRLNRA